MRDALIIASLAALAACVDGGQSVALPEPIELGFVVLVEDGLLIDARPFDDAVPTTTRDTQELFLVAFDTAQLLKERPDLDLENKPQLIAANSMCPNGAAVRSGTAVHLPITDDVTRVWKLDRTSAQFVPAPERSWTTQLMLELERDAERCATRNDRFVPFANESPLLEAPIELAGSTYGFEDDRLTGATKLREIAFLDDDRVLGLTDNFLFVFERGQPFVGDDSNHRHRTHTPDDQKRLFSMAVLDERTVATVASQRTGASPPFDSTLEVYEIGPEGIVNVERVDLGPRLIRRIVAGDDGAVYAFSDDGAVGTATNALGPYTFHPTEFGWKEATKNNAPGYAALGLTTNAEAIDVGLSGTRLDLRTNEVPWMPRTTATVPESLGTVDDVIWLGSAEGLIYRRDGLTWTAVTLEMPYGRMGCSAPDECGLRANRAQIDSVATDGSGRPFVVLRGCTLLYALPHGDHCRTDSISVDGPMSAQKDDFDQLGPSAQRNGEVVVGGSNGHLWLVESTPIPRSSATD